MAEYIEREALIKRLDASPLFDNPQGHGFLKFIKLGVLDLIEKQPAADVVEVRYGKWVDRYGEKYDNHLYECSECKEEALCKVIVDELGHEHLIQALTSTCPNCGAKMDGGNKDG